MFAADLEYWLNNYFDPSQVTRHRCVHTQSLNINGQVKDVGFSVVTDDNKRSSAQGLINDRYAWRGYGSAHSLRSDPFHTTFAAETDQEVVSTITLAIDSDHGLALDRTFSDVADEFRWKAGTRICELTKLAFDAGVRSREVLARLFHLAFIHGTITGDCTDLFIEVNPRHVRFYEMMLGFCRLGAPRTNASVGASSQLMHLKVDVIRRNIREMAGKEDVAEGRSLYPHFFPPHDEHRIRMTFALARLLHGEPSRGANKSPGRKNGPAEGASPVSRESAAIGDITRRAA